MTNNNSNTSINRVFGLDIFRAMAILLVVFAHGRFFLEGTFLEGFPYYRMLGGVELFFVLSGFLIGGILIKEINQQEKFGFKRLLSFWKRRWFRTLPNYYLVLLLNYVFVRYDIIHEKISEFNIDFFFFIQNFKEPFHGFFWESWSISIEEWFYLITPLLLIALLKALNPKQAFIVTIIAMIMLPLLYRMNIFNEYLDPFTWDVKFRKTILSRLDSIGYGLFAAWAFHYFKDYWMKYKYHALVLGIALITFIVNFDSESSTFYKQTFYFSITPLAAMLLIPFAESIKTGNRFLVIPITHISKMSYSMYLIILALVAEVLRDNVTATTDTEKIGVYLLFWLAVIIVSSLMYKYFEKPMMDLRDKKTV